MFSFLFHPITAALGFILSMFLFWFSLFSKFSYMVGDFFNLFAPCLQNASDSIPCQASWNIHVGMTALVVGIIFFLVLASWAIRTFGKIVIMGVILVGLVATVIAVLTYFYNGKRAAAGDGQGHQAYSSFNLQNNLIS